MFIRRAHWEVALGLSSLERGAPRLPDWAAAPLIVGAVRSEPRLGKRKFGATILFLFVIPLVCGASGEGCRGKRTVGSATCIACHDGRTASDKREFDRGVHRAIDCETCHGPGSLHVRAVGLGSGSIDNPARLPFAASMAVCATCHAEHLDGFSGTAHAAREAASCHECHDVHKQGAMRFTTPNRTLLGQEGYALTCGECHATQVLDYAASVKARSNVLTCAVCHDMHRPATFVADPADNAMCIRCHQSAALGFTSTEIVDLHTGPFHPVDPAGSGASRCTACHLPPLAAANQARGPHDHSLMTIPPAFSNEAIAQGIEPVPPNSCSGIAGCHDAAVPGSGAPYDVTDVEMNELLQQLYETIGKTP